jgi:hypothetical protein
MATRKLELLIPSIFNDYKKGLGVKLFPRKSEIAGLALEWLAVNYPALFFGLKRTLKETQALYRSRSNYSVKFWYRLLPIDCVLCILTNNDRYLDSVIANINHHNFSLRELTFITFYFAAPFLYFDEIEDFLERTESNLQNVHLGTEMNLYLINIMLGNKKEKVKLYNNWLKQPNICRFERIKELLEEYRDYESHVNPFAETENKALRYLLSKIIIFKHTRQLKIFE